MLADAKAGRVGRHPTAHQPPSAARALQKLDLVGLFTVGRLLLLAFLDRAPGGSSTGGTRERRPKKRGRNSLEDSLCVLEEARVD